MKILQLLVLCVSAFSPLAALAADNISVTVNGQTYACSGTGNGGNFKYYCKCENENSSWFQLNYHRLNRDTGEDTVVRHLRQVFGREGCEKELREDLVCRH